MGDSARARLVRQNKSQSTMQNNPLKPLTSPSGQGLRVAAQSIGASTVEPDFIPSFPSSGLPWTYTPLLKRSERVTTGIEVLPKYRISKTSFGRNLQPDDPQDEPSLSEILEQERNAWLDSADHNVQMQLEDDDLAQDGSPGNSEQHQPPHVRASRPKQKSCFLEGSMNETSKAVASTWEFLSDYEKDCDRDQSDCDRTPRAAASSRASTCSSFDINEFKPLPATPSTFKDTIKRLGQRVINSNHVKTTEPTKVVPDSEVKVKRGLRKSISSWRMFSNSLSGREGDSGLSTDDETSKTRKTKTSKYPRDARAQYEGALPPKSVLDERKRKAELAYIQQFGTMRKKPRYSDVGNEREFQPSDIDDYAQNTVGQRGFPARSVSRTVRRRSLESDTGVRVSFTRDRTFEPTTTLIEPPRRASSLRHNRSHSDESELRSAYKNDLLKKQSRRELEKENQRLRLMLRQRGSKTSRQGQHDDAQEPSHVGSSSITTRVPITRTPGHLSDRGVGYSTQTTCMKKQQPHTAVEKLENVTSLVRSLQPKSSPLCRADSNIPPMPAVSSNLQHRGALSVGSGNVRRTQETPTVKRRTPVSNAVDQAKLPRPLSMVLEGLENESDHEQEIKKAVTFDETVGDENSMPERKASKPKPCQQDLSRSQQWTWPEDVF